MFVVLRNIDLQMFFRKGVLAQVTLVQVLSIFTLLDNLTEKYDKMKYFLMHSILSLEQSEFSKFDCVNF